MSESTTLSGGTEVEATAEDSVHTAVGGLLHAAQAASDQYTEEFTGDEQSRQDQWVNFLNNVVMGPRDFTDPEGTIQYTESNNTDYQEAFGQTSPGANTERNTEVVVKLFDGAMTKIGPNEIEPQDALYQPQLQGGEVIPVVPEEGELEVAKKMVEQYVCRVVPEAEYMFEYIDGDYSALPAPRDAGNSTTQSTDMSQFCETFQELGETDGIGPSVLESLQETVLKNGEMVLDPDDVNRELTASDLFETQGDYVDEHGFEAAQELKEEEPEVWEELGE